MSDLNIAEQFKSVQGEGRYMGRPSVFFRTAGCNYICGGQAAADSYEGTEYEDQTESMADGISGDMEGDWVCDTIDEWMDGEGQSVEEVYEDWQERGWIDDFDDGTHLILTGGEPTIQQEGLSDLLDYVEEESGVEPYVEVESNGSIYPGERFREHVDQWNLSPKLTNAGMPRDFVYHPENMKRFAQLNELEGTNADLKVVVNDKDDWEEVNEDYIEQEWFDEENVFLMPAGLNQEKIGMSDQDVAELAFENNLNYSDRLQVRIWNEVTGV